MIAAVYSYKGNFSTTSNEHQDVTTGLCFKTDSAFLEKKNDNSHCDSRIHFLKECQKSFINAKNDN